jgi:hypothetical protein
MSSLVILSNAELQGLSAFLKSPTSFLPACLASVPAKLEVALRFIPPVPPALSQTPGQDVDMEISLPLVSIVITNLILFTHYLCILTI